MEGEWALTLLGLAFGLWAGVVGWIGKGIRSDLSSIFGQLQNQSERLNEYVLQTETRLARIEFVIFEVDGGKAKKTDSG